MTRDVAIIGGGVIGCAVALKLADAGLSVALFERNRLGCEASRAAAGMLSPQADRRGPDPFFDLCNRSRAMYRGFAEHVAELSGIDVEYQDQGTLCVALNDRDLEDIDKWSSWQPGAGLEIVKVSSAEISRVEPSVTESAIGGVILPRDHQIENRKLMDALAAAIRQAGVEILEGKEVDGVSINGGRSTGVTTNGGHFAAGLVVVAAGCWSSRLLRHAGIDVEVVPARGQMLALEGGGRPIAHIVHSGKCYLVPRKDNRVLVGSTVEYVGYRKGVTAGGIRWLLDAATKLVPALEDFELVESWSGLRPDTVDHLPVIGPSGIDRLLIATGHFRNGILLAPITAELIAKAIVEGRWADEARPFAAERFAAPAGLKRPDPG